MYHDLLQQKWQRPRHLERQFRYNQLIVHVFYEQHLNKIWLSYFYLTSISFHNSIKFLTQFLPAYFMIHWEGCSVVRQWFMRYLDVQDSVQGLQQWSCRMLYYAVYDFLILSRHPLFWLFYYLNVTICACRNENLNMTRGINFQG